MPNSTPSFITAAFATGKEGDPAPYFRRSFTAPGGPIKATLRITAVGLVEPWLNGNRVGDEVLAPGWTSYRNRLAVRCESPFIESLLHQSCLLQEEKTTPRFTIPRGRICRARIHALNPPQALLFRLRIQKSGEHALILRLGRVTEIEKVLSVGQKEGVCVV